MPIIPEFLLLIPMLPSTVEIVPVFVRILMVPPFRNPSFPIAVINLLLISSSTCPPEVRKLLFVVTEIVPLLVMVALVASPVETAVGVSAPSIVTPELIVTLEPSPSISNSEQFVVIITVVPETTVQTGIT